MKKFVGCDIEGSLDMMDDLLVVVLSTTPCPRLITFSLKNVPIHYFIYLLYLLMFYYS